MKFQELSELLESWGENFSREDRVDALRSYFRNNSGALSNQHLELHFRSSSSGEIVDVVVLGKQKFHSDSVGLNRSLNRVCERYGLALAVNYDNPWMEINLNEDGALRVFSSGAKELSRASLRDIDLYIARVMFAQYEISSLGDSLVYDPVEIHKMDVADSRKKSQSSSVDGRVKSGWVELMFGVKRLNDILGEAMVAGPLPNNFPLGKYCLGDYRTAHLLKSRNVPQTEISKMTGIPEGTLPMLLAKARILFVGEEQEPEKHAETRVYTGGRNRSVDYGPEECGRVCQLRAEKKTFSEISELTGIPRGSLHHIIHNEKREIGKK